MKRSVPNMAILFRRSTCEFPMEILRVPKLNENMDSAMVGRWSKEVGQHVKAGDVVVELVTDKAAFELQSEEEGELRIVSATEKSTVPVGYALAVIAQTGETLPEIEDENTSLMEAYTSNLEVNLDFLENEK